MTASAHASRASVTASAHASTGSTAGCGRSRTARRRSRESSISSRRTSPDATTPGSRRRSKPAAARPRLPHPDHLFEPGPDDAPPRPSDRGVRCPADRIEGRVRTRCPLHPCIRPEPAGPERRPRVRCGMVPCWRHGPDAADRRPDIFLADTGRSAPRYRPDVAQHAADRGTARQAHRGHRRQYRRAHRPDRRPAAHDRERPGGDQGKARLRRSVHLGAQRHPDRAGGATRRRPAGGNGRNSALVLFPRPPDDRMHGGWETPCRKLPPAARARKTGPSRTVRTCSPALQPLLVSPTAPPRHAWSARHGGIWRRTTCERANSSSGPISWLSAARRAAIYLARVSLTSVRFCLPHVNGS